MTKLENVKQENFMFIDDYYYYIKENVLWYGIAFKATKEEMNRKTWEYFRKGLGSKTRQKLIETLDGHSLYNYLNKLRTMEKEILKITKADVKPYTVNKDRNEQAKITKEVKKDKWCKHHKFYGHHTRDCIYKKKNEDKEEKATIMIDPREVIYEIVCDGKVNDQEIKVMFDSGAPRNFISRKLVDTLKLETIEDKPIKTIIADNTVIESNLITKNLFETQWH